MYFPRGVAAVLGGKKGQYSGNIFVGVFMLAKHFSDAEPTITLGLN